jgi:hypothetical protein
MPRDLLDRDEGPRQWEAEELSQTPADLSVFALRCNSKSLRDGTNCR